MAEIFGIDLAFLALFVTIIGVGASVVFSSWANKRATVKDVKEHTDLIVDAAVSKVEAKLEVIEVKVSTHETLLNEIKKINKEDVESISEELKTLRAEVAAIEKSGAGGIVRAEWVEKRLDALEKKIDSLMERAFQEAGVEDKKRKDALRKAKSEEVKPDVNKETKPDVNANANANATT